MHSVRFRALVVPFVACAAIVLVIGAPTVAFGDRDRSDFTAQMVGFHENPAVFSNGTASVKLNLNADNITFELRYSGMTANPLFSHIHLGEQHANGGVIAFFCGGGSKPACPPQPGLVTGTITAADILVPSSTNGPQGLTAGDLEGAKRAIRSGAVYANVHTPMFPTGELRGQVVRVD
jgi:hypothetical protein